MQNPATPPAFPAPERRIGDTPLQPILVPLPDRNIRIWLKLEAENPFGSIKARTADALLAALEDSGELRPGRRVVESSSGNLGVALAGLCAARGYRCTLVVEPSTPEASIAQMTAYGADVVVVGEVPGGKTVDARLEKVWQILAQDGDAVWTNQYQSPANPRVHEVQTAIELVEAAPDGGYDAVAVAVSTGGTLAGIARGLRTRSPTTRIIAVDAVGSVALGGAYAERPFKLAGFGSGRISEFVTRHHWDDVVWIRDEEAVVASVRVRERTGVSLGGSAGATVLAAVVRACLDPSLRELLCVCPDGGEKYPQLDHGLSLRAPGANEHIAKALNLLGRAIPA